MNNIMNILTAMKAGTFHHFTFKSVKDTVTNEKLYKISIAYARTKINNASRQNYVQPTRTHNENVTYIVQNCVKHNNNTNNDLIVLFPRKNNKIKSYYVDENNNVVDTAYAKSIIVEKKYNNSYNGVITPKLENIIAID